MAGKKEHQDVSFITEESLTKTENFLVKNKKLILGSLVSLIVLIAAGILYVTMYAIPRSNRADEALFKAQEYFNKNEFDKALNGDSITFKGFIKIADEFSGTDAANLANAYAGLCFAHLEKHEEAINYLERFSGKDQMVAPAILGALGDLYASTGELDKATSILMKAAKQADNRTLSPIYLMKAADIYMSQGNSKAALEAYETIKNKYFDSYQAAGIDKYIELAKLKK